VRDVTAALVRLLATPAACGEVFNVGGDREVSINELAALVAALAGSRSEIRHVPYQEAYGEAFDDMERRVPDLAKVRALIGYQPCWSLEQAIQDVIGEVRGLACPAVGETTGCDSQETPAGPAVNPRG
jgi:UDP-glucose 4-epimerase